MNPDDDDPAGARRAAGEGDRQLITTLLGVESRAVRSLLDQLGDGMAQIDPLLDAALSDPARLEALRDTGLADCRSHPALDRIAELTAEALGTSQASINLITPDAHLILGCSSAESGSPRSRPLSMSLSKFTVASREPLIVDDATQHPLLVTHPAVEQGFAVAFAAIPLADRRGNVVGTLSTWHTRGRKWTSGELQILENFAAITVAKIFST